MIDRGFRILQIMLLGVSLTSCSKFEPGRSSVDSSFFIQGETALNPSTDKLSSQCFGSPEFDACLFQKNPVAQERTSVPAAEAGVKRFFGVKIRGLAPTGFLENARVQIYALHSARFTLRAREVLKTPGAPEAIEQFSAYYWSNRMFDYLGARVGEDRLPLRGLKIYVDDAFTGYSSLNNSIHLQKSEGALPRAFSGEVVVHLAAQALANSLSQNKLFGKNTAQHNFCALDPKGCCASAVGCAQALANSFGEYTAAMMFPASAKVGESVANSPEGQKICSIARDLPRLAALTRAQVFGACDTQGRAVLMGAWYASQWWKLRAQIEAQESGASADVDKIFFDHARVWDAAATFTEAKAEALRLAGQYKSGKYAAAFAAALNGI